ncbi:fibronectin type III domain-containing protein [Foetidibacter luteolus]|uniref:fibronectin type III domain-containing protein n=1 Tax=Foetidibacter luteolus TaxID=2608880 RepID=UPI00129BAC72|nr:fibronectin type III domain-containing protein [Foetidibacter luteolus]
MNSPVKVAKLLLLLAVVCIYLPASAQTGVLDPADPVVVYNAAKPPTIPPSGTLVKWVKTNRMTWNTSSYKCYFYKGVAFRLKFPKTYQHNVNDGKKYPVYLFFHGKGEKGTIYDNEYQLKLGAQIHMNAVDNGTFDGFLVYPQSIYEGWGQQVTIMNEFILNYLVPQVKADRWRIYVDGLSAGGGATWNFMLSFLKTAACVLPISNTNGNYVDGVNQFKFTPVWQFQGGLDKAPSPGYTQQLATGILNAGANYKLSVYPTVGHSAWNQAWAEPDYFPFLKRAYKSNPWALYGKTEFNAGETINVTVGVSPGFTAYEWRKNDVLIAGATGNQITATSSGKYSCRIKDGTLWSDWSPTPVEIKTKGTVTPVISVSGLMSKVIPALDGKTYVTLAAQPGYASYAWLKSGSSTVLGTGNTFNAGSAGNYIVQVKQTTASAAVSSAAFSVIDANGANKPDPAGSLTATALSSTSVKLSWVDKASPAYNETNYEIYRATSSAGPYTLIAITAANAVTYTNTGLAAKTSYSYKLRAVNTTGASAASNIATVATPSDTDTQAPTAPAGLIAKSITQISAIITWSASTDNVGVTGYQVYKDGVAYYSTTALQCNLTSLLAGQTYTLTVKARDAAGNYSASSSPVTVKTLLPSTTDTEKPTAPAGLKASGITQTSATLAWAASTDNVGVTGYQVYQDDISIGATTSLQYAVSGLKAGTTYTFTVKAKDAANNFSASTSQVTVKTLSQSTPQTGLTYKYYQGLWTVLPDFSKLTPVKTGNVPNVSLSPRTQDASIGFLWEGFIKITTAGSYSFRTKSDDGSKLYLGALNGTGSPYNHAAAALVNNDGLHGGITSDGTVTLSAGIYPIAITYFNATGGMTMFAYWKKPGTTSFVAIPDDAFTNSTSAREISNGAPVIAAAKVVNERKGAGEKSITASVFPNPFADDIIVTLQLDKQVPKLDVAVYDASGKPVYRRGFGTVAKGRWQQKLGLNGSSLKGGVYFVEVYGLPGRNERIKVIKQTGH